MKKHRSEKLFSDFNTLQFAGVMGIVLFVMLIIFMIVPVDHHGTYADLPKVSHAVSMPGAQREDVMMAYVLRDGSVYFGSDRVIAANLPEKIQDRLKDRGIERKVYLVIDMRAHWGTVKPVLDGVRSAGILRIAFLVNRRNH